MVTNVYIGYSMGIMQYPIKSLHALQGVTLATLKHSMCIPSNMDMEPFFVPMANRGRGLVSLLDLQATIMCASTFHELNSSSLSKFTTMTTWMHTYALPNSNISCWLEALKVVGLTVWPKLRDIYVIGHATPNCHRNWYSGALEPGVHKKDSISFSLTPNFSVQSVVPTSVHCPHIWLQKEGENSKKTPFFVEGVFWLNFGVLVGYARNLENCAKKGQKP